MVSGRLNVARKRVGWTMAQARMRYLALQYLEVLKIKAPLLDLGFDFVVLGPVRGAVSSASKGI